MKKIYLALLFVSFSVLSLRATIHVINVELVDFNPSALNVIVGDTVRWSWVEGASFHTTTATVIPIGATSWDELIDTLNQQFDYVVSVPGTYDYICIYHEIMGMIGSFTATGTSPVVNSDVVMEFTINNTMITDAVVFNLHLLQPENVQVVIYDMQGKLVKDFGASKFNAGTHLKSYSVSNIRKSMYFINVRVGEESIVKKIILL